MTMVPFAALLVVLAGRLLYLGSGIPERVGGTAVPAGWGRLPRGVACAEEMVKQAIRPAIFKWGQTDPELICCVVRWHLRYSLSFRDVEDLLRERVLEVARWRRRSIERLPRTVSPSRGRQPGSTGCCPRRSPSMRAWVDRLPPGMQRTPASMSILRVGRRSAATNPVRVAAARRTRTVAE